MSVSGIGGFFFRAVDPDAVAEWYKTHLGISFENYEPWMQAAGPTVFQPFENDTDHFPKSKQWMLNLRVDNIDALLAKLRGAGVDVTTNPEWDAPETGRFARITDPEGNVIELWEPPSE